MVPVDATLPDVASRMGVNVSNYLKPAVSTVLPQGRVAAGMKGDCPRLTSIGIQVVVAYKRGDAGLPFQPTAQ